MEFGLIGERLGHSYSADIHAMIGHYDYALTEVSRTDMDAFMKCHGFRGINVTIPYKQTVIPYLDFIDDAAREIGAVNTIVNRDGRLYGYNTDYLGLLRLIKGQGIVLEGRKVLILGTGGTSRTARAVARSLGAAQILVVSRRPGEGTVTYEEAMKVHSDARVIINTTPCGMFPDVDGMAIDLGPFGDLEAVVDVVYNPLRTRLVQSAHKRGLKACGGLYMLVQQAVAASELFFDNQVEDSRAQAIYRRILSDKQNIVLVGMPGSGKTTVGRILSQRLSRPFVDTDLLIGQRTGRHPSQIISEDGEDAFRDIESTVISEVCKGSGAVVSTGGGAILRGENVAHMRANGMVFFIDRSIEDIEVSEDRPLSSTREKLLDLYNRRYGIYCASCDVHILNNGEAEGAVRTIMEALS